MAPQKSVTEVPRSILPRLTWNGTSARTAVTSPQTTALSAGRQQKQQSIRTWIPADRQLHSLARLPHSSISFAAAARETGTSSIARRFPPPKHLAAESLSNPIRYNGVYVAAFNPARRAFHASAPHQRDHHFDTLKFVQRLKDEGFSEEQAVAMMRVLNDVIQESIQNLTRTMVLREDTERSAYTQKVDFAKLRSELLNADSTEAQLTRSSHEKIAADLAKLNSRLRDEIGRTQASVRLDLNLEKGRIREEANGQEMRIKETETRIEQEVAGLRERVEAVKFSTLQWLMATAMLLSWCSALWLGGLLFTPAWATLEEVFEVYQPVPTEGSSSSGCNEEMLLMDYVFGYSYGEPYIGFYEPPQCTFDTVRINLTVTSEGTQYDRLALMYLGDTEVFRTSTAEPTTNGIIWTYIKDMSQFNVLWKERQKLIFDLGNIITDVYTGSYNTTLTAYFSYEGNVRTPDAILPISARKSAQNASSDFELPSDNATVLYQFPPTTSRAVVSISACGQSTEEFWWSNVFSEDEWSFENTIGELYGYSPFREIQLYIDGTLAGVVWPFPIIFTGGVAPGFWHPIVGIDAFDLRQPEIDISPFLPLLTDNSTHSFEIKITGLDVSEDGTVTFSDTVGSYWVVTGTIFLYLDESASNPTASYANGQAPEVFAPAPTFTATRDLVQNSTGGNETLSYSILAERSLTVKSSEFSWTQNLSYSNYGLLNQEGLSQSNLQHTSGKSSIVQLTGKKTSDEVTFEYPLFVNETYSLDDGLTISAWMRRGLDIESTGGLGVSTYTLTSGPLDLHTEQKGTAYYQSLSDNSSTISTGETTDVFESHVPESLATAFIPPEQLNGHNHPTKRRKLVSAPQSLRELNGLSSSQNPPGYIPLARLHLRLSFASTARVPDGCDGSFDLVQSLPVVLRTDRAPHAQPGAAQSNSPNDCFNLELLTPLGQEPIFTDQTLDPEIVNFGRELNLASSLACADRFPKNAPSVCYQSTLRCLFDKKTYHLETVILWRDSLDVLNINKLPSGLLRVFSKYILHENDEAVPDHAWHKDRHWREARGAMWSPRDFYGNVYVPEDTPNSSGKIECGLMECQLFPFQRRAVRWLLRKEGVELLPDGRVIPTEQKISANLPIAFFQITDADGRGGILAEEMGLGKTVEMISLMCLNRRILPSDNSPSNASTNGLKLSRATLIITPPAILEQWRQEIELHAPGLRVFQYNGIQRHQKLPDGELVELVSNNDVVLTTYNILAREVHYSGDAPKRNLRHEKRFEPRRTPLVQISWWRVCLDEAQMVESGVSNAARVARLIPRQMAWAVTGTPLRKDITDFLGLLLFLHYEPFCGLIWNSLCTLFQPLLARIVHNVALRHSKDHVRDELRLPPQKRVVITVPFSAVEEQHYAQLYEQMCEDCGLDLSGAPLTGEWNPDRPSVIEKMRSWLDRLRQICLYPAGNSRRGLNMGNNGPLRSVNEVLEVMIDQTDVLIHSEERSLLLSQLRRGQLLENAMQKYEALSLWKTSLERTSAIVKEFRDRLQVERMKTRPTLADDFQGSAPIDSESDDEAEEAEKNTRIGTYRQRLRMALEIQHICVFFIGNAYYQIKSDPKLTAPDSDQFKSLDRQEEEAYATAKSIRKEMLVDVSRKVGHFMRAIREKSQKKQFVDIPRMKPQIYSTGLEARRVLENLEDFCKAMNQHAAQYDVWRQTMIEFLSQSLIDQEDESELEGDEYEKSTKHQDEMYVYMEALRAMFADRHDCLTGQKNVLIAHEVKGGILQAQKGEGPSPKLFLQVMNIRSNMKPDPQLGSLRGIISELRSLTTSLEWQANEGSSRARAELEVVSLVLKHASQMAVEQSKVASNLDREVEMFRDTMNNRLEYYRQLQQISDTVAPYDEESLGKPLDEALFSLKLKQESNIDGKISALRAKRRYLIHLRDESGSDESSRICVICQSGFEVGTGLTFTLREIKNIDLDSSFGTKIDTLARHILWIREHDPGTKAVIFSQYKSFLESLAIAMSRFKIGYSNVDSKDGISSFKSDPAIECFLLHAKAHSSGLNLVNATHVFLCEPLINTAIELQAIARVHRIGQHRPTTVWMYLISDTVEQSIYDLSVSRRLAHIVQKEKEQEGAHSSNSSDDGALLQNLTETAIDSANSLEMQDATLSKLMTGGVWGGELVKKDDLWQCLFGVPSQSKQVNSRLVNAEGEVARFLRGEAAEQRRMAVG
ncbi:hypothetical protein BO71DRAFT_419349 [Aspergillus ellipticus CBS 707.79]|uniref:Helicase C-terminal domain-containing protein n=1 Tax=Aspergillus ellipticus CBS 707.79 TaxID=1448320 RepID=A0A319DSY5_9EURO|nr:hypothetical protein BO71DRAFT_419349 [Aspergillus ellipticus CBS 707.79]